MGAGVYRCGICGGTMRGGHGPRTATGNRMPVYVCRSSASGSAQGGTHVTRKMEPLDELVTAAVLAILEGPGLRARLVDETGVDLDELRTRRAAWVTLADELATMFAANEIDASQLRAGTADLRTKIAQADRVLADAAAASPAAALLAGAPENGLWDRWNATSADLKGKIIDELMVVTINPAPRGSWFDPDLIDITPKR